MVLGGRSGVVEGRVYRGRGRGCRGVGRCDVLKRASLHAQKAREELSAVAQIVGGHHQGEAVFLLQAAQQMENALTVFWIQGRERLVREENLRSGAEGPGDGHPLSLPAREAAHPLMGEGSHTEVGEDLAGSFAYCG